MKFKSYVFRIVIVIAFLVVLPSFVVSQSDDIPEISTSTPEDTIKDVPELLTDEQITDDGPIGSNGKILTITGEQVDDDPRTWKYFRIAASVENDSLFIWVQDDMEISPKLGSYFITVDLRNPGNEIAFIGSEDNPLKLVSWGQLSNRVQSGLINFTGAAKENLNPTAPNFASVFTDVIKKSGYQMRLLRRNDSEKLEVVPRTSIHIFRFSVANMLDFRLKAILGCRLGSAINIQARWNLKLLAQNSTFWALPLE